MQIIFADNSILYTRDFQEGARRWNEIYHRIKDFNIKNFIKHYDTPDFKSLALYSNTHKLIGIVIYEFCHLYGSEKRSMILNMFQVEPTLNKTYIIGKFLKHIEKVAKSYKCDSIVYPDCTYNNFFEKHKDRFHLLEKWYIQEL